MIGLAYQLRDLRHEAGRIVPAVFGVVWGTMAVTILVAFGQSTSNALRTAEQGMGRGIAIVRHGATSVPFDGLPAARPILPTLDDARALEQAVPGITAISGEYISGVEVSREARVSRAFLSGVECPYGSMRRCLPQPGGRFINEPDMQHCRRVAFLGDELKERLFGTAEAVGQTVLIGHTPFTVVGVMEPKLQMSSYHSYDKGRVFIPLTTYESLWGRQPLSAIIYRPPSRAEAEAIRGEVRHVMGRRHRFDPADRHALSIWDTTEGEEITENIHLGVRMFMLLIGVVTLIVAGVGVGNMMYVLVKSQTREIGIKIAVGARPRDITMYHLFEGLVIVLVGGGLGLLMSWLIIVGLNAVPMQEEALMYFGRPKMSVLTVVIVATVLGLVGLVAGLFPARQAALTEPVEALRYE